MPFPLQDTTCDPTAGEVMEVRSAHVSPGGVPPMATERGPIAAPMLLEAAHDIPPIVTHPCQQGLGRVPRLAADIVRLAAQAMVGIAEARVRQRIVRGAPLVPTAHPERNPARPMRPDQPDQGKALEGPVLLAGKDPGEPCDGRRNGLGHDRIIEHERAVFPGAPDAQGVFEESWPRPIAWQHPGQAVMRHGFQYRSQSDTSARCASREQCGEIEPHARWPGVPSVVTVGSEL